MKISAAGRWPVCGAIALVGCSDPSCDACSTSALVYGQVNENFGRDRQRDSVQVDVELPVESLERM